MFARKNVFRPLFFMILALAVLLSGLGLGVRPAAAATNEPTVQVYQAVEDSTVTFKAFYLPTNSKFDVLLSRYNSKVKTTYKVASFTSKSDGTFDGTVTLPYALYDIKQINVQLVGSNWSAETWYPNFTFKNNVPIAPRPGAEEKSITSKVFYQDRYDVYQGEAGLFGPSSNYTGWLKLERFEPQDVTTYTYSRLNFQQDLVKVGIYDSQMHLFDHVWGFNYLYFNLTSETRRAYNQGKLDIYYFDTVKRAWQPCDVQVFVNKGDYGRLSCVISNWGYYALATPLQ